MGCGIEAASFKYGMFDALCVAYEILNAKGEVHGARPPPRKWSEHFGAGACELVRMLR